VHNRTIGNLTVRADPSVRTAASISIDESVGRPRELDAEGERRLALASLERAVGREEERRRAPLSLSIRIARRLIFPPRIVSREEAAGRG
jgi:hypothetical protein